MDKKTVRDVDVQGKRVLVRVDFNVPLAEGRGEPTIPASARRCPPSATCWSEGAIVILASHLGRPKDKVRGEPAHGPGRRAACRSCWAAR